MADENWRIRVTVNSAGGRIRLPAGSPGGTGGQFVEGGTTAYRQQLKAANRRMAQEVQAEVLENMRGSILRRKVSSGRLLRATASPENIEWDEFHYGVGREDYLNKSIAKYWRTVEEGSAVTWEKRGGMIGLELTGLWGGSIGRTTGSRVYAGPPWSPHSANRRGDMFVPAGGKIRLREGGAFAKAWSGTGGKSAPNFVGTTTVKNEAPAHNDYENAFRSYRPGQRAQAEVMKILQKASREAWRME